MRRRASLAKNVGRFGVSFVTGATDDIAVALSDPFLEGVSVLGSMVVLGGTYPLISSVCTQEPFKSLAFVFKHVADA